jgi:hypothetical protein
MPRHAVVFLSLFILAGLGRAQQDSSQPPGTAAFLFGYHPKPGMQAQFDEGYRRHLRWHEEKKDPLVWYAWYVSSGERTGMFIDGSFGIPFAAFDRRVEPKADVADFSQTSAPFADTAFRSTYRLRPDLSTGQLLENRLPSPQVEVVHYVLRPGMEKAFEEVIGKVRAALKQTQGAPVQTWYELVIGGETPGYMLMVPRQGWADFETPQKTLGAVLEGAYGAEQARALRQSLAAAVAHTRSELWSYRQDLSYFPPRP